MRKPCANLRKHAQTCANMRKPAQTCANRANTDKSAQTIGYLQMDTRGHLLYILLNSFLPRQKKHFSFAIFCCTLLTISKE